MDTGLTGISDGTSGNQIGTAANPLEPVLGPLQNNGGPTRTRTVLPGSPALDRGSASTCPAVDQRGIPRPLDGDGDTVAVCDVGAYEAFTLASAGLSFFALTPCRIADTRGPTGPAGGPPLAANATRFFPVTGACGVPIDARAVALNATVVNPGDSGNLRFYPAGASAPVASTINFAANRTRANNALVPLGAAGQIAVQCDMPLASAIRGRRRGRCTRRASSIGRPLASLGSANLVLDVYGYLR